MDQSHELETRVPPSLIMHATARYPPRLVEAILRCLSIHLRRKNGVHLHAVEVGIGPHVDHDVQDADFNETRLLSQKYYDQDTVLELDPVGTAAARQSEIDFAWRLKACEPRPRAEACRRMGRKPFGMRWIDCSKGMSSDRSFGVVWSSKRNVRLAPSASRISQLSHQARHRSKLFVCFALS